jgi:rubrerythrin
MSPKLTRYQWRLVDLALGVAIEHLPRESEFVPQLGAIRKEIQDGFSPDLTYCWVCSVCGQTEVGEKNEICPQCRDPEAA